ncbi:MAG: nickel-responsive transcriptional regulator NikR [Candidatus Omnitrophica bacterium]|nr:nickel-responsive transcriptional regulator NikR [Candidatus Omnitrophota bacterium]
MTKLMRQSFSIEGDLYQKLEQMRKKSRYQNRSEFLRDLIRHQTVQEEWGTNEEALGVLTLIYDHDTRNLNEKLNCLQHHHHHNHILAATHVHLDEHLCAEMIMIRGNARDIQKLADLMRQQKGVLHAVLSMSSTGKKFR